MNDKRYEILDVGLRVGWGDRSPINPEKSPSPAGIIVTWSAKGVGFGEFTIVHDVNGDLEFGTEAMSKEFCMAVLEALYDRAQKHNG